MTSCNPVPVAQPGKGGVGMGHTSEPKQLTFPQLLFMSRDLCRLLAEPFWPAGSLTVVVVRAWSVPVGFSHLLGG